MVNVNAMLYERKGKVPKLKLTVPASGYRRFIPGMMHPDGSCDVIDVTSFDDCISHSVDIFLSPRQFKRLRRILVVEVTE